MGRQFAGYGVLQAPQELSFLGLELLLAKNAGFLELSQLLDLPDDVGLGSTRWSRRRLGGAMRGWLWD